jgi:hypothetical protein
MEAHASHSGSTELARQELNAPDEGLRVDVLGVSFDDQGALLSVKVFAEEFFSCPEQLLVVRSGSTVLGHRYVQTEGYSVFGLKSGLVPCTATTDIRIDAGSDSSIQFELYDGDVSVDAVESGTADGVVSQSYFLDDLADVAERTSQSKTGPIQSAISSSVTPIVKGGLSLAGVYLVVDNLGLISDLTRGLLTSDE